MKIGVVGAGGVGGYFGARLAQAGNEVGVVGRGDHLKAIREHGLRVRSIFGDTTVAVAASADPGDIGPCDVVLFCVKSYDAESAATLLPALLGDGGAVVSLQNGVDSEAVLAAAVGADRVIGGVAYIFSTMAEPGVIEHTGGPARLVFGELDGQPSQRTERLLSACQDAGIEAEIAQDIRVALWTKFAFICATAGMTAATRLPLGDIRSSPESWDMFARIIDEVVELARLEGVPLPDDISGQLIGGAAGLEPGSYSSLHHDLVTGHRMELEALHGAVVARANRLNLAVPACEAINAILQPWALRSA
ncbi:MAG: 2-dehydropantoate 2-reductase [Dermatophilaceae bacterium]